MYMVYKPYIPTDFIRFRITFTDTDCTELGANQIRFIIIKNESDTDSRQAYDL